MLKQMTANKRTEEHRHARLSDSKQLLYVASIRSCVKTYLSELHR